MLTLNTQKIIELGQTIENELIANGVESVSELKVPLCESDFKRVDEDIFYTLNRGKEDVEFVPSKKDIVMNFERLRIVFEKG